MTLEGDQTGSLMQKLKIAVAVGCLKSKPEGVTGKEYAQQLCNQFQRSQLLWKQRCEKAETESLHLQQELVLQQNRDVEHMETDHDGTKHIKGNGKRVLEALIQRYCLHGNPSSESELFPTPPSSGSHGDHNVPAHSSCDVVNYSLSRHTVFLHHVISLETGSKQLQSEKLDTVIKKSIEHSLDVIKEHIGGTDISNKLQIQCMRTIDKLYSSCDVKLRQNILETVRLSAEKLISRITASEEYRSQTKVKHTELLQELSRCKDINIPIIEATTESILTFSDHLRSMTGQNRQEKYIDPYYFCNIFYIINSLEQCLQSKGIDRLSKELADKIQSRLDDSLLHLTVKFPLFAHAVWRLTEKLNL